MLQGSPVSPRRGEQVVEGAVAVDDVGDNDYGETDEEGEGEESEEEMEGGGGAWTAERGPRRRLNKTAGRRIERLLLEGRTEEAQTLGWAGDESELDLLLGRLDGTYDVECVLDKRHGELGLLLSTRHGSAAVQDVVPGSAAERDGTLRQGDVVCEVNGRVVLSCEAAVMRMRQAEGRVRIVARRRAPRPPPGEPPGEPEDEEPRRRRRRRRRRWRRRRRRPPARR